MIGKIKGTLIEISGNESLIETSSGVSYQVFLPPSVILNSKLGEKIYIYTYLQVKEDAHTLFGFSNKSDYNIFKLLLSVDGVGPKLAFTIISFTNSHDIETAIRTSDVTYFNAIPGIGKKTAQKILLELSGKFDSEFNINKMTLSENDNLVIQALLSLGFDRRSAHRALSQLEPTFSVEDKIKHAIKKMTNK